MLRKEVDKMQMSEFIGLAHDSDEEEVEDESDVDYYSDSEIIRTVVDYDIEKMFEIISKRDFSNWSISHINDRYRKIHLGDAGRKQISR